MKLSLTLLLFISISGCGLITTIKVQNSLAEEQLESFRFKEQIFFENPQGTIIIKASLDGEERNFILDTGCNNVILDEELSENLHLKKLGSTKTGGTNGIKKRLKHHVLDELSINGVRFSSVVCSTGDLSHLSEMICMDISGIIGANIMSKCIWQIDYQQQLITFSDKKDSLQFSGNEHKLHFYTMGRKTPILQLSADHINSCDVLIDTGSNGGIDLNPNYLNNDSLFIEKQYYNSGIHGTHTQTMKIAKLSNPRLSSDYSFEDQFINYSLKSNYGLVGNRFLKNHTVTLDWFNRQILLDPIPNTSDNKHFNFGFYPMFKDHKVTVGSVYLNSQAYKKGLRLNDEIISINGEDLTKISNSEYCTFSRNWRTNSPEEIDIKVISNNAECHYILTKTSMVQDL